ncbi:MAG: GNAT family N-acetyltransferase [Proteobacteria bacterium]|nr:GNAT family N-acetyltransferase [Pseudomonadota bacterium]
MIWLEPITLTGKHASLTLLSQNHHDDLIEATKDGELWKKWNTFVPSPEEMQKRIELLLEMQAKNELLPFAVIDANTGKASGITTYMNIDAKNHRLEIGSTWYRKSLQRTAVNTECKLMLLKHAFEEKKAIAVEFRTHRLNVESRKAIERIGAKLDGILRNHMYSSDGTLRDTAVYSIISTEWPAIKSQLNWYLTKEYL